MSVPLSAVGKIYVEVAENEGPDTNLGELLRQRLRASNLIVLTPSRDNADALLKLSIIRRGDAGPEKVRIGVQLINAHGTVIWPTAISRAIYYGSDADVCARIVKDLLTAVQRSRQR